MGEIIEQGTTEISISVVSHQQIHLIEKLLHDIEEYCQTSLLEVLLTLNLEEHIPFRLEDFPFSILVIRNSVPEGFAANHDRAFTQAKGQYFCVLNPDIRLENDPFQALITCLQDKSVGVVAPVVVNSDGEMEDSARRFPGPLTILCKVFGGCKGGDYAVKEDIVFPDWVGGMFMLFRHDVFKQMGGFDTRFFLYYEDVDLCARLRLQGYQVALSPDARIVHEARRDSHRRMSFFKRHLTSMLRFFLSPVYWQLLFRR